MDIFKKVAVAGAVATTAAFAATGAAATPFTVSGLFTVEIKNFDLSDGTDTDRDALSQASVSNFGAVTGNFNSGASSDGVVDISNFETTTITWDGELDFDTSLTFDPNVGQPFTTISDFFASGTGTASPALGGFGDNKLSAGTGLNDGGVTDRSRTTTLMKFTANTADLNISDMGQVFEITHDDGITISDGNTPNNIVDFVGPNSVRTTEVFGKGDPSDLSGTSFTLFYAAANGDPSILKTTAVPLPAAAWLLLAASGGLIAAKRKRSRAAA